MHLVSTKAELKLFASRFVYTTHRTFIVLGNSWCTIIAPIIRIIMFHKLVSIRRSACLGRIFGWSSAIFLESFGTTWAFIHNFDMSLS